MAPPIKQLTYEQYTVGWVCALPKEMVAARAMLDEEHLPLPKPANDSNTYTVGRVGNHNVVIACLPMGEIGNSSSAIVATRMTSTFPFIKFGLMVGIGGGVPKGVRLGDVVVSTPAEGFGGVVQWDFGKTEQGRVFKRTGALNSPPSVLRTALAQLKAMHEMEGSRIPNLLEDMAKKWPKLKHKYVQSSELEDILFKADYNHVEVETSDEDEEDEDEEETGCIHCDRTRTIRRKPRNMRVHYGLIASGNQVIKDASFRDEINKRLGGKVLCFEMEAAGLMNDFPCIVVRGIRDYADSHKNKAWQGHAAAVAAAMAKELLLVVPAQEVSELPAVAKILQHVEEIEVNVARLKGSAEDTEHRVVLHWLSDVDQSSNHHRARSNHTPTTGDWLLKGESYGKWIDGDSPMVWLHGIPGCGKTIISSTIIDNLQKSYSHDQNTSIAYFYFDFGDKQKRTVDGCLRHLLRQLSAQRLPSVVKTLYTQSASLDARPSLESVMYALKEVLLPLQRAFLILDALDECEDVEILMAKLAIIRAWKLPCLRILATSRIDTDIERKMLQVSALFVGFGITGVDRDIRTAVAQRLECGESLRSRWSDQQKKQIQDTILAKSKGMFQLAQSQLREIERCYSPRDLKATLARLPESLNNTYERMLFQISSSHRQSARRLLQWLVCSVRPLLIEEAAEIFAFDFDTWPARVDLERRLRNSNDILRICPGLVTLTTEGTAHIGDRAPRMHVKLVHSSLREYLVSPDIRKGPMAEYAVHQQQANESIAEICLAYLLRLDGPNSVSSSTCIVLPLARYAAEYWTVHALLSGESMDSKLHTLMEDMFIFSTSAYFNWMKIYNHDEPWRPRDGPLDNSHNDSIPSQLYIASLTGLHMIVRVILDNEVDLRVKEGFYGNALHAAASAGHVHVVRLFLGYGMDVGTPGIYGSVLHTAAYEGHVEVCQLLLDKGADVNSHAEPFGNVLQAAVYGDHPLIARMLLERGADITAPGSRYADILHTTSTFGRFQILQLLLDQCHIDPFSASYNRALQAALDHGNTHVLELLKGNGPSVHFRDEMYGSSLHTAAAHGYTRIVELLLDNGADINCEEEDHGMALHIASSRGDSQLVQLLLDRKANVNIQMTEGTALHIASSMGHTRIIQLLLDHGADIEAQGGYFGTALQGAAAYGQISAVRLLLHKGARVNEQGGHYGNALQAASYGVSSTTAIVQLLLDNEVNVNAEGGYFGTALQAACYRGNVQIARLLLENGAGVNCSVGQFGTALQAASCGISLDMQLVQLLLDHGADVNVGGGRYDSPLKAALSKRNFQVAHLLRKQGAQLPALV